MITKDNINIRKPKTIIDNGEVKPRDRRSSDLKSVNISDF